MKQLEKTINSREVAEMVGKQHKELLRDIRNYITVLTGANMRSSEYFVPSEYIDAKKRSTTVLPNHENRLRFSRE